MAGSYVLPQVRVFQEFAQAPNDVTQNLNPFVIGANYNLLRYSDPDTRGDCATGSYDGTAAVTLKWKEIPTGSTPDTSWYGVTFADVYAALGAAKTATCIDSGSGSYGTKFEFTLGTGESLTDEGGKAVFGTPVKAGDYLQFTDGGKTNRVKIKSIGIGKPKASEADLSVVKLEDPSSEFPGLDVTYTTYRGETDVTVYLTVTLEGSTYKAKWSTTHAGMPSGTGTLSTTTALDLGLGLTVKQKTGIAAGDCVITLKMKDTYVHDTVTTETVVKSTVASFTFIRHYDSVDIANSFLSPTTEGVTIASGVTVKEGSLNLSVKSATAYLNQRNLVTSHADGVYSLTTEADIIRELGAITPDNPLAYGAHIMLLNCAAASVKYIALEGTTYEDWVKAIDRSSVTTDVYAFCPLTENKTIIDEVVRHCKDMSTEENKSWRIAFFSLPTNKKENVTPRDGSVYEKCTVATVSNVTTLTCRPHGGTTTDTSTIAKFNDGSVHLGDKVTVTTTTGKSETRTVTGISGPATLILSASVSDASSALCAFSIIHELTKLEYVNAVAAQSSSYNNRRAYNVWPNTLYNADGECLSGMYAAAAVCGLACSVTPQQPITNVEIQGFTDIPDTYSTYSRDELNTIAAGGTLIVMQEKKGGQVYVRHQISTAYSSGNVNTTELSLTKNLDSISYYFANRFAPYIGRYNVTDDLLTELEGILKDGLAHLETATETNRLIGPQVLVDGTEIRALYTSDEKDKVYASVALNLPAPFNNFDLHLQVI